MPVHTLMPVHICCTHKVSGAFLPTNGQGEQWASHSARAIGCLQQANMVLYGEKLLREKTFFEFRGFVAIYESFLCKILGLGVFWVHQ